MDYPVPRIAIGAGDAAGLQRRLCRRHGRLGPASPSTDLYAERRSGDAGARATAEAVARLRFVTDADARVGGDAQPWGSLWDNGADPVAELGHLMQVRRIALDRFGLRNLLPGDGGPRSEASAGADLSVHRYQVDAVAKLVGGIDYGYPVAGDGREAATPVPAADAARGAGGAGRPR